jgi:hypothetical protein
MEALFNAVVMVSVVSTMVAAGLDPTLESLRAVMRDLTFVALALVAALVIATRFARQRGASPGPGISARQGQQT